MDTPEPTHPAAAPIVQYCATCRQHFSGDARFCPFDGDPLRVATAYRPECDPLLGTVVDGRYEVVSVLGEGGMGTVYEVVHRALDKSFAMKVMRADLAREGDLAARFIQEARAAASVGHLNIVQITDFGRLQNRAPYFVMELLEGVSLAKLIRSGGPLPAGLAVRILQQVAAGLAAAHAAGVIHRDLKPDNIHLSRGEVVKILDFGVAKMAGAGRLTKTGMVFGTPHYMSPEQASGGEVDHRADVYALGIIMYEMFTGRVPFEADSYMGVLTKHLYMQPEPPSRVHQAARELGALEDVTLRCLAKRPDARYPSMEALVGDIESIVRFAGERIEILRPSSVVDGARGSALADELEAPRHDELRVATPADGMRRRALWAGLALTSACVALSVVAYQRQERPEVRPAAVLVNTPSEAPMGRDAPPFAPPLSTPAEAPSAELAVAPPSPDPTRPTRATPASSNGRSTAARPREMRPLHRGPDTPAPRSEPASGIGVNDIINPWAK